MIVADAGSRDATADGRRRRGLPVHRHAGAGRRAAEARPRAAARAPWLLFLQPGTVPDSTWIEEASRFVEQAELADHADALAAVFRPAAAIGGRRPIVVEALALFRVALGAPAAPEPGLLISKRLYDRLGGHRADRADPERDLLRRIGRRRIVMLRSGAINVGDDSDAASGTIREACDGYADRVYERRRWNHDRDRQISSIILFMIVRIVLPVGVMEMIGSFKLVDRVLRVDGAHVQGLARGALGRKGLNAIGRKLLEEADVDQIVIQGGVRTTGRDKGKRPRPIRFPNR